MAPYYWILMHPTLIHLHHLLFRHQKSRDPSGSDASHVKVVAVMINALPRRILIIDIPNALTRSSISVFLGNISLRLQLTFHEEDAATNMFTKIAPDRYSLVLSLHRYVLSILKFTYPTVFQGWQTLVSVLILKLITWKSKAKLEVNPLDRKATINMLPHFLFYVGSIVAGSKALASLPVPVFLSACNLAPASIYLLDHLAGLCTCTSLLSLLPSLIALFSSAFVLLLCDSEVPVGEESPYFWMLVHVVLNTAQTLHDRVADPRFSAVDRLYYSNLFGSEHKYANDLEERRDLGISGGADVAAFNSNMLDCFRLVILAPASLYLEEAFLALQFRHRKQTHFYFGCLLSGILGVLLRMHIILSEFPKYTPCKTLDAQNYPSTKGQENKEEEEGKECTISHSAVSAIFTSLLSLMVFPHGLPDRGVTLSVTASLLAALFIKRSECPIEGKEDDTDVGLQEGKVYLV
ncbi:hypothetical protein J437_LFUL004884 [Ladona fulva]|uniref:Uncharacterized protein n=1 Tax=Ladona fulva TaxID=123851 RepID=A0A8K0JZP0_LADFU|nr:hypothetical protein J437_LFUL004884 [Ladona fulva]